MNALLKKTGQIEDRYAGFLIYFVLIPFLHPRGFGECWLWYKNFFKLWLYMSMAVIAVWIVYDVLARGLRYTKAAYWIIGYHVAFIIITILTQGGLHEGLQKMFGSPALCLFCMMQLRQDPRRLLRAIVNILIVGFVLNVSVFCFPVAEKIISIFHVNFLGHVQVSAQFGLLGMYAGCLLYLCDGEQKERMIIILCLSVVSMLWAGTAAGLLALAVLAACLVIWSIRPVKGLLLADSRIWLWGSVALSVVLLLYALTELDVKLGINALSVSGRTFVWRDGLAQFWQKPFLGYGAYGAKVVTFWSEGMNYAHNELLQRLLDGGILLTILFYGMLNCCVMALRRVKHQLALALTNGFLIAALLVMQFESVTEYYYLYLFFALTACLPEICAGMGENEKRQRKEGTQ